ncbi:MAG: Hint domain-containing protein [Paracoccaceae bacterium]
MRTTKGDIAIEELRVGMMVKTHDYGPLPIHWISSRKVRAIFTRN